MLHIMAYRLKIFEVHFSIAKLLVRTYSESLMESLQIFYNYHEVKIISFLINVNRLSAGTISYVN